ncbi:uncharacterized protein LOC131238889 [Magnolia sinica]|uniref:uncharacterized protein LOC131238889 n=1 Tax=Magnolia sinica TaxID=86752 RepID=UPI002658C9A1|nr:uncharacterized protein LOC131238889 [Magnolia sinica]
MTIANYKVYHILVDIKSLTDIIYSEAFERMGIDRSHLRPMKTPLHCFVRDKVIFEGAISLPMTAGEGQHQVTLLVDLLLVNALTINVLDSRAPIEDSSMEDLVTVPLKEANLSKMVLLGSSMNFEQRSQMLAFLQQHKDVFAWSHKDMPGISLEVMVHKLNVNPNHRPMKQKRRAFDPKRYSAIVDEVSKLRLFWIDQLVDNTTEHELISFLDAYSGYNQIAMHPLDR